MLFAFFCAFSAYAQDSSEAYYYNEYDDYYEMEQDYLDSIVDQTVKPKNKITFSVPAMAIGATAGLAITYIVLDIKSAVKPDPYFRKAEEKHEITNKADAKINEVNN